MNASNIHHHESQTDSTNAAIMPGRNIPYTVAHESEVPSPPTFQIFKPGETTTENHKIMPFLPVQESFRQQTIIYYHILLFIQKKATLQKTIQPPADKPTL